MGNSINLVDMIRGYLTGDSVNAISSLIGASGEQTRAGVTAAVPGLLAGLDRAASTPDGVRRITSAIDDSDESMLDNPLGMFSRSFTADSSSGMLHSIMGAGGLSELTSSVGRASGLSGKGASSIIAMLAPLVFGVLKRVKSMAGPGRFDVADLLAGQRANIAAAAPGETYAGPRVAASRDRAAGTYTEAERPHRRSHTWAWILPLALLIGGLWLLSNRTSRPGRAPSAVQAGSEETTTRPRTARSLDELKMKYGSVLREAQAQGIRISDLRVQDGKLIIKGTAPSQEAANNVWNEIKRIDPPLDDISADLKVASTTRKKTVP